MMLTAAKMTECVNWHTGRYSYQLMMLRNDCFRIWKNPLIIYTSRSHSDLYHGGGQYREDLTKCGHVNPSQLHGPVPDDSKPRVCLTCSH